MDGRAAQESWTAGVAGHLENTTVEVGLQIGDERRQKVERSCYRLATLHTLKLPARASAGKTQETLGPRHRELLGERVS